MAKCLKCGKKGIFLKLNSKGLCYDCESAEKAQIEEARRQHLKKLNDDAKKEWDTVCNLPVFKISKNPDKIKVQSTSFLKELTYSNITAKSNVDKLGKFVVFDIETTGLSSVQDDIVEIAAIKYENFTPVEIFSSYISPQKGIKPEAMAINHISEDMVKDAPLLYEIIPSLQQFIAGYNLVAHNFEFDFKFLCRGGLDIVSEKRKYYDTMRIAQKILKSAKYSYDDNDDCDDVSYDVENHKLETLCDYYDIIRNNEHRALSDCFDTARLFKKLFESKTL